MASRKPKGHLVVGADWLANTQRQNLIPIFREYLKFFAGYITFVDLDEDEREWKRQAHNAFCYSKVPLAGALAAAMNQMVSLSTPEAQAQFLELVAKERLDLGPDAQTFNENDLSAIFFHRYPKLFLQVFVRLQTARGKTYDEYTDPTGAKLRVEGQDAAIEKFKEMTRTHRAARNSTRYLDMTVVEDDEEIIFYIARGAPARSIQVIEPASLAAQVLRVIPTHNDHLIYYKREHRLALWTQDKEQQKFYVGAVGLCFLNNPHQFQKGDTYTCDPLLRDGHAALKPHGDRMTEVRLKEISLSAHDADEPLKSMWKSRGDVMDELGKLLKIPDLQRFDRADRAVLGITFSHLKKEVEVIISRNTITVKLRSVLPEVRAFLRARGFVVRVVATYGKAA